MTQSTVDAIDTVMIPGELKMSQPIVPPVIVQLPIYARASRWKNVVLGIASLIIGLPMLATGVLFILVGIPRVFTAGVTIENVLVTMSVGFMVFYGIAFTGAGLTCLADAILRPVLIIDANGLEDGRSRFRTDWSSIKSASYLLEALDLQLREPVSVRQNPFRVGRLFARWLPKPGQVIIPLAYLDVRRHVLFYTVLTLVREHGGEASAKTPHFDMGLRILPQPKKKLALS